MDLGDSPSGSQVVNGNEEREDGDVLTLANMDLDSE
jgi:hypothetical protein